jgi:predicted flap endonuclease-1-like 5' DNA nuclease
MSIGAGHPTRSSTTRRKKRGGARLRALAVAFFAFVAAGGFAGAITAPTASAGEITDYFCRTPAGAVAPMDGWTVIEGWVSTFNNCAPGPGFQFTAAPGTYPSQAVSNIWFRAPSGTAVQTLQMTRTVSLTSSGLFQVWTISAPKWFNDQMLEQCESGCTTLPRETRTFQLGGAPGVRVLTETCGTDVSSCVATRAVNVTIESGSMVLTDDQAPTYASRSGTLLADDVKRGNVTLTAQLADVGVGLYRVTATADGHPWLDQVLNTNGGKCATVGGATDFEYAQPCALTDAMSTALDTTQLGDGTHHVVVTVDDAAQNQTVLYDGDIVTDNFWAPTFNDGPMLTEPLVARVGGSFTRSTGSWNASPTATLAGDQWFRCPDTALTDIANCSAVNGATSSTYVATADDAYGRLVDRVTVQNTEGSATAYTPPSNVVADESGRTVPAPQNLTAPSWLTRTDQPHPGDELTIIRGIWRTLGTPDYAVVFERCSSGGACSAVQTGDENTYTVQSADIGSTITAEVTAATSFGSTAASTPATGAVSEAQRSIDNGPTPQRRDDDQQDGQDNGGGGGGGGGGTPLVPGLPVVTIPLGLGTAAVLNGTLPSGSGCVAPPQLTAQFVTSTARKAKRRAHGKKHAKKARAAAAKPSAATNNLTVAYGKGARLRVTLSCGSTGEPVTGAQLAVATSIVGARTASAQQPTTDKSGRVTIALPRGVSRSIAIGWRRDSHATTYAAQTSATLRVRSQIGLRITPHNVGVGHAIKLIGKVAGAPKGIRLNVQALAGKTWRTFDQTTTHAGGKFSYKYRFGPRSQRGDEFTFRVQLFGGQRKLGTLAGDSKPIGEVIGG